MMTSEEFRARFDEALRLARDGSPDLAVQELKLLLQTGWHPSAVTKMLGLILQWDIRDSARPCRSCSNPSRCRPIQRTRRWASFTHAGTGPSRRGLRRARRYLSDHKSDAYDEAIREINRGELH